MAKFFSAFFLKFLPVVAVLTVGLLIADAFIKTKPRAEVEPRQVRPTLVEVIEAQLVNEKVVVQARGAVLASRELALTPEVSGRIIELNPDLVPGGFIKQGELVARIDSRDYEAAYAQAEAQLLQAKTNLALEQGRQNVARREYEFMNGGSKFSDAESELALRKPQLENAQAMIDAAQAGLDRAKLNLERTTIRAPFNAMVQRESVELGQLISPQTMIASLVGTDEFWVQANLQVSDLKWFDLPDRHGSGGAAAKVIYEAGHGDELKKEGKVLRLLSGLDPAGRMARLLVSVDDPLGLKSGDYESSLPLMIDAFVKVKIEGRELEGVIRVPRVAVRDGDRVWVMNEKDELEMRDLQTVWRDENHVLVSEGISPGEWLVVSRIAAPIPGMKLRVGKPGEDNEPDNKGAGQ